jgi:hypothetical protein
MRKLALALFAAFVLWSLPCDAETVDAIKQRLLALAQTYSGQADPTYAQQRQLEAIIDELLAAAPPVPLSQRLNLLEGVWKQVWGPLDYRTDESRSIDPELGIDEIYQVILPSGIYYNVSPIYPGGDRRQERTGFLRGKYKQDPDLTNRLDVHFTSYRGIKGRPKDGSPIYEMAYRAEEDKVDDTIAIVPWIVVQLFFGSGALDEVYTDQDLRILYGSNGAENARRALYVMTRVISPH